MPTLQQSLTTIEKPTPTTTKETLIIIPITNNITTPNDISKRQ